MQKTSPFFHIPTEKKVRFQIPFIKLSYNIVLDIIQQFSISGERPYIFIHQHFQRICGNTQRLHGFKDIVTAEYSLRTAAALKQLCLFCHFFQMFQRLMELRNIFIDFLQQFFCNGSISAYGFDSCQGLCHTACIFQCRS